MMLCPADLLRAMFALAILSTLSACVRLPTSTSSPGLQARVLANPPSSLARRSQALGSELAALGPAVREEEAMQLAFCACDYSTRLAQEYRVFRPALLHNLLVNVGVKKRGLCYQWAEDLLVQLQRLHPVTLELHWGIARAGTYREHNCLVITAQGQPFAEGIVLDAWRHSGQLISVPVASDSYPWQEGQLTLNSESSTSSSAQP